MASKSNARGGRGAAIGTGDDIEGGKTTEHLALKDGRDACILKKIQYINST